MGPVASHKAKELIPSSYLGLCTSPVWSRESPPAPGPGCTYRYALPMRTGVGTSILLLRVFLKPDSDTSPSVWDTRSHPVCPSKQPPTCFLRAPPPPLLGSITVQWAEVGGGTHRLWGRSIGSFWAVKAALDAEVPSTVPGTQKHPQTPAPSPSLKPPSSL